MVTGEHDMCWNKNEEFAATLRSKGIPTTVLSGGEVAEHDWNWWLKKWQAYLP